MRNHVNHDFCASLRGRLASPFKKSLPVRGGRTYMDKDVPVSVWPEWELIEKIGEGSFGKVYKAKRTERGRSF